MSNFEVNLQLLQECEGRAAIAASVYTPLQKHIDLERVLRWAREKIMSQQEEIERLRRDWGFMIQLRAFLKSEK